MVKESKLGETLGVTQAGTTDKIVAILKMYNLPQDVEVSSNAIYNTMKKDKKVIGKNQIDVILLEKIGKTQIKRINLEELLKG